MILSVDPDSKIAGYAVLEGPRNLVEAGVVKPKARDSISYRADTIVLRLSEIAGRHHVSVVVVEKPAPQQPVQGKAQRGQADFGYAVGRICGRLAERFNGLVNAVPADKWTRGKSKGKRARELAEWLPQYDPEQDPGLHVADAIGVGVFWLEQAMVEGA